MGKRSRKSRRRPGRTNARAQSRDAQHRVDTTRTRSRPSASKQAVTWPRKRVIAVLGSIGSVPLGLHKAGLTIDLVVRIEVRALGVLAAVLAGFQIINSVYRVVRAHHLRKDYGLRRLIGFEFGVGGVGMSAIATAALSTTPNPILMGVLLGGAGVSLLIYDMIERGIWTAVESNDEVDHCTVLVSSAKLAILGSAQTTSEWAKSGQNSYHHLVDELTTSGDNVSPTRSLILTLMMCLCCGLFTSTVTLAASEIVYGSLATDTPGHEEPNRFETPNDDEEKRERPDRGSGKAQGTSSATTTGSSACDAPGVRREDRLHLYGYEIETLDALYNGGGGFEADPPPGTAGGCTAAVQFASAGPGSRLVYLIGTGLADEVLSVAFVSKQFFAGIVTGPAGDAVLRLVDIYGDIGGTRRINRGSGQLYGIETPYGTAALVRHLLRRSNGTAQPYLILVPAAVGAWREAMRANHVWLWPIEDGAVNGKQRIRLVSDLVSDTTVATMYIDPASCKVRYSGQAAWGGPYGHENDA